MDHSFQCIHSLIQYSKVFFYRIVFSYRIYTTNDRILLIFRYSYKTPIRAIGNLMQPSAHLRQFYFFPTSNALGKALLVVNSVPACRISRIAAGYLHNPRYYRRPPPGGRKLHRNWRNRYTFVPISTILLSSRRKERFNSRYNNDSRTLSGGQ